MQGEPTPDLPTPTETTVTTSQALAAMALGSLGTLAALSWALGLWADRLLKRGRVASTAEENMGPPSAGGKGRIRG